jgi:hypothetical protein
MKSSNAVIAGFYHRPVPRLRRIVRRPRRRLFLGALLGGALAWRRRRLEENERQYPTPPRP